MFDKHKIDNHKVNYKDFLLDLKTFEFNKNAFENT